MIEEIKSEIKPVIDAAIQKIEMVDNLQKQVDKTKDPVSTYSYSIGAIIVVGFFIVLGILIFRGRPDDSQTVSLLVGALISMTTGVIGYFFGSSSSSAKKDQTINNIVNDDKG